MSQPRAISNNRMERRAVDALAANAPIVRIAEHGGVVFDVRRSRPSAGDHWACCPFHAEKTPSFHVVERAGERYFRCHGCGAKGDAIALAMRLLGCNFRDAVRSCNGGADMRPDSVVIAAREQRRCGLDASKATESNAHRDAARSIYAGGGPIVGTGGENYFRLVRAIAVPLDHTEIRFHPTCPFNPYAPDKGKTSPAIVAAIRTADGAHIGTHCTFIRADGSGKAYLPHLKGARMVAGEMAGGFICLGRVADAAVIGEGIESTLSASQALGVPGLAAISAGNMAKLMLPWRLSRVLIAFDRDEKRTGENAANTLAERAWANGVGVELAPPPDGFNDWNDAAKAHALGGVHVR